MRKTQSVNSFTNSYSLDKNNISILLSTAFSLLDAYFVCKQAKTNGKYIKKSCVNGVYSVAKLPDQKT